jgi:hypothetical protein
MCGPSILIGMIGALIGMIGAFVLAAGVPDRLTDMKRNVLNASGRVHQFSVVSVASEAELFISMGTSP